MPSGSSSFGGGGGGGGDGIACAMPGFGRAGNPELPFESTEPRERCDAPEALEFCEKPLLLELPRVSVLLWLNGDAPNPNGRELLAVLGLRSSARPAKGPGAMLSIRFMMLSPPFILGLKGAKRGLGAA